MVLSSSFASAVGALVVFFVVEIVAVGAADFHYLSYDFTLFHYGCGFFRCRLAWSAKDSVKIDHCGECDYEQDYDKHYEEH